MFGASSTRGQDVWNVIQSSYKANANNQSSKPAWVGTREGRALECQATFGYPWGPGPCVATNPKRFNKTLSTVAHKLEASIAKLTEDISELTKAVADLDAAMAEATKLRVPAISRADFSTVCSRENW